MTAWGTADNVTVNVLRLLTFGGLGIEPDDGAAAPRLRPPRLALLAVLAATGDRGVSRERLAALFWPDADEAHASHSLRQARYALRNDLGCEVIRSSGSVLSLDESAITADVCEFRAALAAGERDRAASIARGPFLDGFYLPGASAFERWVEEERARLAAATASALISLATEATRTDQRDAAVEWWQQLTTSEPLSGRFALGYLKALAARGDRAEALAFARRHQALVQRELETDPDSEIRRLEAELRAMPSPPFGNVLPDLAAPARRPAIDPTPSPAAAVPKQVPTKRTLDIAQLRPRRLGAVVAAVALLVFSVTGALTMRRWSMGRVDSRPVLAVGLIRDDGVPDAQRVGRVLTDMLATNLARVEGLAVLSNSRLLELIRPGRDSSAGYAAAARRAGASELLEGRLIAGPGTAFSLDVRRVDLATGLVKSVHRVSAADQYALVDSLTQSVARNFRLLSPASSVAQATSTSPAAYRLYEEGLRAYAQSDVKAAQQLMHAALEEDSTFAMAAYYEVVAGAELGSVLPDGRHVNDARGNALRLAARAPERERLTITANLLAEEWEPRALAVAESLTTRFPDDPRALITLSKIRWAMGDWPGAASVIERAIALDSVGSRGRGNCQICEDYDRLGEVYLWWDSLPAAERTARRYLGAKQDAWQPLYQSSIIRARLGDSASTYEAFHRLSAFGGDIRHLKLRLDLTLESYGNVERDARTLLASASAQEWGTGAWSLLIALRNEGRLREAAQLHRTGRLPGMAPPLIQRTPDDFNTAILAIERGEPRVAAEVFARRVRDDASKWSPGYQSRLLTWNATLEGMALAAAGDTAAVRLLADSVEKWGRGSAYGRDRKAHHYLRGLVLAAAGRDTDAVREFGAAIHSPSLGFTRVNYELARSLLRLKRPLDAAAVLQAALRGEVDASNLYVTRTDLHELLAQSFDAAGRPDNAALHYRAVVSAWRRADPEFYARRARAVEWLNRYASVRRASGISGQ